MEQKLYNALCKFMEHQTKDYKWYHDTPKQRFKHSPKSIWLINPKTKGWVLELEKGGKLWWYYDIHTDFQRYFNMEQSDFEEFIKVWVEDVINRGVSSTSPVKLPYREVVEDVINRGVSSTHRTNTAKARLVEDVINRGVSSTSTGGCSTWAAVEDVINRGVSSTTGRLICTRTPVEDVINRGVSSTQPLGPGVQVPVEDVLNHGKTIQ